MNADKKDAWFYLRFLRSSAASNVLGFFGLTITLTPATALTIHACRQKNERQTARAKPS
jgi:hypothetical protein